MLSPLRRRQVLQWSCLSTWPAAGWTQDTGRPAGTLLLGGTGCGMAPLQRVLGTRPALKFVPNLGTSGGLRALAAGAIDVALAARPLSDAEKAADLNSLELLRTPLVFAVNAAESLRSTTLDELAALYAGRVAHWKSGTPVRVVLRPEGDSDSRFVDSLGPAMAQAQAAARARPGTHVATTDGDASLALDRIAGSLGVTTLGLLRAEDRAAQALALDGVPPSLETLRRQRYAHVKTVYLVTRGKPPAAALDLIHGLRSPGVAQALAGIDCLSSLTA